MVLVQVHEGSEVLWYQEVDMTEDGIMATEASHRVRKEG